ncbi:MAG: hypothetical protein QOJ07_3766, partial [Thermoleophilaceae bacterium]|nr:hypothetical protein [Thermoleophilaceae bacterium]
PAAPLENPQRAALAGRVRGRLHVPDERHRP